MAIPGYQNTFMGSPKLHVVYTTALFTSITIRLEAAERMDGLGPHIGMASDGSRRRFGCVHPRR